VKNKFKEGVQQSFLVSLFQLNAWPFLDKPVMKKSVKEGCEVCFSGCGFIYSRGFGVQRRDEEG
jgi:hypothetical protein